jgi:hypothetical protein
MSKNVLKKKFCITHMVKIRDVVEAEDKVQALMVFRAKYPAALDKEATLIDIQECPCHNSTPSS